MPTIIPVESERILYSGGTDPGELYRRLMPPAETGDNEISEHDLVQALRQLDPDTLARTLEGFDDDQIEYLSTLIDGDT